MKNLVVKSDKFQWFIPVLVVVVGLVSRLLLIDTNVFFPDGDEAIVGLMALDILDGHFPFYFYGQSYGFSFLEALFVAWGVAIWGTSTLAVKIPMLLLWLGGVSVLSLFFYKTTQKNKILTILFILLVVLSPTWIVWSMKARGGYLTSFLLSSILVWMTTKDEFYRSPWYAFTTFLLLIFTFEAQPLWFFPTVWILGWRKALAWGKYGSEKKWVMLGAGGALLGIVCVLILKSGLTNLWETPLPHIWDRLSKIGDLWAVLASCLGGNYFLSNAYLPSNQVFTYSFMVLFLVLNVVFLKTWIQKGKAIFRTEWFLWIGASYLSLAGFFIKAEPRYLLPFFVFAFMGICLLYAQMEWKPILLKGVLLGLIFISLGSLPNFRQYSYVNMKVRQKSPPVMNDMAILNEVLDLFDRNKIKYGYSSNEFLAYQLCFFSNREVKVISKPERFRVEGFLNEVYQHYQKHKKGVAALGYNFNNRFKGKVPVIGKKVGCLLRPSSKILKSMGLFDVPEALEKRSHTENN